MVQVAEDAGYRAPHDATALLLDELPSLPDAAFKTLHHPCKEPEIPGVIINQGAGDPRAKKLS